MRQTLLSPRWRGLILLILLGITLLYGSTIQRDISGSPSEYTLDTGEFQVALALWGTLHHTGYPLYSLLGSPFVAALQLVGISPALGASLFSLLWGLGSLLLLLLLHRRLGGHPLTGLAGLSLLAATHSFWIHSVVAEVYSQALFLLALALWLTLHVAQHPQRLPWLAALLGLAVGLHRAAALLMLWSALYLLATVGPRPLLQPRLLLRGALAFLGSFLVYLYLPLRGWMGASWLFGPPDSWEGFWGVFFARGVSELMVPEQEPARLIEHLRASVAVLQAELTLPGLLAGCLGLLWAAYYSPTRKPALLLAGTGLSYVLFTTLFPRAVFLPAVLLPTLFILALGVALLLERLAARQRSLAWAGSGLLIVLALLLARHNKPLVEAYSEHPRGRALIDSASQLPAGSLLAAPWGTDYFALAYGQRVSGELAHLEMNTHEYPFLPWAEARLREGQRLILPNDLLYVYSVAQWEGALDGPLCVSSAGWQLVALARCERAADQPVRLTLGDGIALVEHEVEVSWAEGSVALTLHWQATQPPSRDYSVFVHLTDQPQVQGPQDIIVQQDQQHPVYGWSPTSRWQTGQQVREDYRLSWPEDRPPTQLIVGMYYQDKETGAFHNLGTHPIPLEGGARAP